MPKIELEPGEAVVVTFKDCDGEITVAFVPYGVRILTGCRAEVAMELSVKPGITVHADLPDAMSREGVVYYEPSDPNDPRRSQEVPRADAPT